jgi:hypothetical protein
MTRSGPLAAALCLATLAGCGDKGPQNITETAPTAAIKFFNLGVNAPSVNFFANDRKLTAISSVTGTESTLGTAYGAAASGGFYLGLTPGQYTLSARISAATDNGVPITTLPFTIADGKRYSMYLSGTYNTATKQSDAFVVEDPLPTSVARDTIYVRLVNGISNAGPLVLVARTTQTTPAVEYPLGGPVAYKAAGNFVALPSATAGPIDLVLRNVGSTTAVATVTGGTLLSGRVYTVAARGDITVTSTTAANRPQITATLNR